MPLLGLYPKHMLARIQNHTCRKMYTAGLFAIAGSNTIAHQQGTSWIFIHQWNNTMTL